MNLHKTDVICKGFNGNGCGVSLKGRHHATQRCHDCRNKVTLTRTRKHRSEYGKHSEDFCTEKGAEILKQSIEDYWAERDKVVNVSMRSMSFNPKMRSKRTDVRSDMKDGWPTKKERASA